VWVEDAVVGFVYNTRLVSDAEVPRKWEDLLNAKFKDKIASPKAGGGWDMLRGIWSEDQIVAFLKDVAKQNPTPTPAALDGLNRVATGDSYLTNSTSLDLALNLKNQQGAPVAVAPLSPLYVNPLGLFTLKDIAHPAAAELFMLWMSTPEAKQAMQQTGNARFTQCGPQPIDQFVCGGKQDIFYIDTVQKAVDGARLRQLFAQTLGFA
jgi:iron(III) transport system substrate-binding protein